MEVKMFALGKLYPLCLFYVFIYVASICFSSPVSHKSFVEAFGGDGKASETTLLVTSSSDTAVRKRQNSFDKFEEDHHIYERMKAEGETSSEEASTIQEDSTTNRLRGKERPEQASPENGQQDDWFFPPIEEEIDNENTYRETDNSGRAETLKGKDEDTIASVDFEDRETPVFIPTERIEFMEDLWYKWSYENNDFDTPTRTSDYVDGYIIEPNQKLCGTKDTERCGPNNWKFLHTECNGKLNRKQSPIDLPATDRSTAELNFEVKDKTWEKETSPQEINERLDEVGILKSDLLEPIAFSKNYGCSQGKLIADTHTWEVLLNECTELSIMYLGSKYDLQQFHFHAPSEHTINGKYFDAEAHFVHFSEETQEYTVLGVLIDAEEEADNPFLSEFWENEVEIVDGVHTRAETDGLAEVEEELRNEVEMAPTKDFNTPIDPYDFFMPSNRSYYMYQGSLTTPNCGTNVNWVIFDEHAIISKKQLNQYRDGVANFPMSQADPTSGNTNRPVQPLGSRNIYFYSDQSGDNLIKNFEPKPSPSSTDSVRRKKRTSHQMRPAERRKLIYEAKKEERRNKRHMLDIMKRRQKGMTKV